MRQINTDHAAVYTLMSEQSWPTPQYLRRLLYNNPYKERPGMGLGPCNLLVRHERLDANEEKVSHVSLHQLWTSGPIY